MEDGFARHVLRCCEVDVGYGDIEVVSGFNLSCAPGEIVALIGPNGSGKSTLLKCISGMLRASGGAIEICGRDSTRLAAEDVGALGLQYVPQVRDVFPSLTVEENLHVGYTDKERLGSALAVFPMLEPLMKRRAGRLSGGERKAVAIARAFMHPHVAVLVLDEPSAGFSPKATAELWPVLSEAARGGMGVLVVEQRVDEVLAFADRAYVIVDGKNRLVANAGELLGRTSDLGEMFVGP